jgi:hypothetical protein
MMNPQLTAWQSKRSACKAAGKDPARPVMKHMWPDKDETTRAAIGGVIAARVVSSRSC